MKERTITVAIFLVIIASSFYFGFHRLENFSGVDEPYWSYGRVPGFWNAVSKMKWKNTNISDKPGIPLAIVSGAGLPFIGESPKSLKYLRYDQKTPEQLQKIRDIYFWLRLPVFLFTLAVLPLFYFLVKKILGKTTARFAILFVGLSPILLGISLIINSDAMLWIFGALSVLSFFVYLEKKKRTYLYAAGFFLGLSVITKYVANILFVFFFLLFLLEYIFFVHGKVPVAKYLKRAFSDYFILLAVAMLTVFVFFPATWIDFSKLLGTTIGNQVFSSTWPLFLGLVGLAAADLIFFKAKFSNIVFDLLARRKDLIAKFLALVFLLFVFFVFLHVYGHTELYDLQAIVASPKGIGEGNTFQKYLGAITADVYSLIFSISPLVLGLLIFVSANIWRKKEMKRDTVTTLYILVFVLVFYLGSTVNGIITTVRYQIMVYPLIFVMAAIGISQFFEMKSVKKNVFLPSIFLGSALVLLASLENIKPHFLAYASEILPKKYVVNLKGMGEGSIEAANYLNQLPNAQGLTIWSDKGAVCEAFVGHCFIDFKEKTFQENQIDYFVLSTDRRSRSLKMSRSINDKVYFEKMYSSNDYVFQIVIGSNPNDFVKVFKSDDLINKIKLFENER